MADMLSQAEINALLGDDTVSSEPSESDPVSEADPVSETDLASEIDPVSETDPILETDPVPETEPVPETDPAPTAALPAPSGDDVDASTKDILSNEQKDILGEVGNISMGTAATTLFALLGKKVLITTPHVKIMTWQALSGSYQRPCVGVRVDYKEGLRGANVLILKQKDVKIISDLMMGGDGNVTDVETLSELDLSAIGEAMNQMIGSSSTSIATMMKRKIDIDTPHAFVLDFSDNTFFDTIGFALDDIIVSVSFRMEIEDLIDSEIMQILPLDFALDMVDIMKNRISLTPPPAEATPIAEPIQPSPILPPPEPPRPAQPTENPPPPPPQMAYQAPPPAAQNINVQPVQFQSFEMGTSPQQKENIEIIMDVPLEVTVELGRTKKKIKDILEFAPGAIIELDKLAGEPIDILINGKFVARGEVVVIDENFGVRITDIISADKRI